MTVDGQSDGQPFPMLGEGCLADNIEILAGGGMIILTKPLKPSRQ